MFIYRTIGQLLSTLELRSVICPRTRLRLLWTFCMHELFNNKILFCGRRQVIDRILVVKNWMIGNWELTGTVFRSAHVWVMFTMMRCLRCVLIRLITNLLFLASQLLRWIRFGRAGSYCSYAKCGNYWSWRHKWIRRVCRRTTAYVSLKLLSRLLR